MFKVYLLGYPLTISWSPVMQQAAFARCRIPATYEQLSVEPAQFSLTLEGVRSEGVLGANITMLMKDMTPEQFSLHPAANFRFDPTALYRVTDFISKWLGTQYMGFFYTITPETEDPRSPSICNVTVGELMFCPENGARMLAGIMPLSGIQEQNYSGEKRETLSAIIEAINNATT